MSFGRGRERKGQEEENRVVEKGLKNQRELGILGA